MTKYKENKLKKFYAMVDWTIEDLRIKEYFRKD